MMTEYICETEKWNDTFDEPVIRWNESIVRCRDCKYFNEDGECTNDIWSVAYGEGYPYVAGEGDGNGFCAWGDTND